MSENDIDRLAAMVDEEVERCRRAGAAVDALPADPQQAAAVLARAAQKADQPVLEPFEGLRFDDECDDRDQLRTMGVFHWTTVLYFALWNKAQYEAEHGTVEG
ncbi:hypothetical protein G7070_16165 [Propioniciclava coleopterorum]|uniref:Uncharacterized protein n=1 Tax=Propioniciclava coleopterorum TaxID=2714937 RepID=A0A6G7YA08_9ACTN|nr:hypothetical protein [Propioniciclava coleopterorum]QIK73516.1 hypothetical protein G7070_16165 [Propioniciclava coleopterorum]